MLQQSQTKLWCIREYGNGISLACCHKERLRQRLFFFSCFLTFGTIGPNNRLIWLLLQSLRSYVATKQHVARRQTAERKVSLERNQTWDICAGWRVTLCSCAQTFIYTVYHTHTHTATVNFTIFLVPGFCQPPYTAPPASNWTKFLPRWSATSSSSLQNWTMRTKHVVTSTASHRMCVFRQHCRQDS